MQSRREQYDNGNVIHEEQDVSALHVHKEERLLQRQVFPEPAFHKGVDAVNAHERDNNAGRGNLPRNRCRTARALDKLRNLQSVENHADMQPDVQRDKHKVPVRSKQVRRPRKTCTRFNPEKRENVVREHHTANCEERHTNQHPVVDNRLRYPKRIVPAAESRLEPAPVRIDMHTPDNHQRHADNLVRRSPREKHVPAHQHQRKYGQRYFKTHFKSLFQIHDFAHLRHEHGLARFLRGMFRVFEWLKIRMLA